MTATMTYLQVNLGDNKENPWRDVRIPVVDGNAPIPVVMASLLANIPVNERHAYLVRNHAELLDKYMSNTKGVEDTSAVRTIKIMGMNTSGVDLDKIKPVMLLDQQYVAALIKSILNDGSLFSGQDKVNRDHAIEALDSITVTTVQADAAHDTTPIMPKDDRSWAVTMHRAASKQLKSAILNMSREVEDECKKRKRTIETELDTLTEQVANKRAMLDQLEAANIKVQAETAEAEQKLKKLKETISQCTGALDVIKGALGE